MHVALVEKDRMVVQLVQQYLAEAGHTVAEIEPSIELILTAACDLLVMDLNQLSASGARLYDDIRKHPKLQALPCILIAGRITMSDVQISKKDTVATFLIKPFTKSVFDDGLHRVLRQSLIRNCQTAPKENLKNAPDTTAIVINWRQDIEKILQYQQRVKSQLQIDPKDIYEAKLKELKTRSEQVPDTKALRRSIIDMILLKSVVIVDRDDSNRLWLQDYARQHSILNVDSFESADEAFQHLLLATTDLIIMDWSSDDSEGLCLYNRLRSHAPTQNIPIVLLSKSAEDEVIQSLFEEDLQLCTLEKPIQPKKLQDTIVNLLTKSLSSVKVQEALEQAMKQICPAGLLQDLVHDLYERLPAMKLHLVDMVHRLMEHNRFEEAERLSRLLIEKPDLAIATSTILAKIYHMTQRTQAATDLLRYVCAVAPHRLDRLLLAAEAEISMLHIEKAKTYLDQAQQIDPQNGKLQALSYVSEQIEKHGDVVKHAPASNLVSILNTVGITLAKSGQPEEAVRYYQSALMIDSNRLDRARLHYNLGLSYERTNDFDKALEQHVAADKLAAGELPKIKSHLEQLRGAMKKPLAS